jgi:hypothetical protein
MLEYEKLEKYIETRVQLDFAALESKILHEFKSSTNDINAAIHELGMSYLDS